MITTTTTKTTTTTTTTTTSMVVPLLAYCPIEIKLCQNDGICLILNGKDVVCSCLTGFSGYVLSSTSFNF